VAQLHLDFVNCHTIDSYVGKHNLALLDQGIYWWYVQQKHINCHTYGQLTGVVNFLDDISKKVQKFLDILNISLDRYGQMGTCTLRASAVIQ